MYDIPYHLLGLNYDDYFRDLPEDIRQFSNTKTGIFGGGLVRNVFARLNSQDPHYRGRIEICIGPHKMHAWASGWIGMLKDNQRDYFKLSCYPYVDPNNMDAVSRKLAGGR